ncbi:MAG: methionine ABC transporter permease [Pseudomonadota bacterium]
MEPVKLFKMVIVPAVFNTMFMVSVTFIIAAGIGFVVAVLMVCCDDNGLTPHPLVYKVLDSIVNLLRSFPFIILIVAMIPITRMIVGTSIGKVAAIVPLVFASAPFIARLLETILKEVDFSVIEAARSFGATNIQIIFKVMVKEAIPSIVLNLTLAIISILGLSAMAGAVGGGGLGAVAIIYGYQSFDNFAMYSTVMILIILVQIIQWIGKFLYKMLL